MRTAATRVACATTLGLLVLAAFSTDAAGRDLKQILGARPEPLHDAWLELADTEPDESESSPLEEKESPSLVGGVTAVASKVPEEDSLEVSATAITNFKYCSVPSNNVLESFLAYGPGMSFVFPIEHSYLKEDKDVDLRFTTTKDGLGAVGAGASEFRIDRNRVRLMVVDNTGKKFKSYIVSEFLPPVGSSVAVQYFVLGDDVTYRTLAEALRGALDSAGFPPSSVYFPLYECGGQFADAVGLQSVQIRDTGNNKGHTEDFGHDWFNAVQGCQFHRTSFKNADEFMMLQSYYASQPALENNDFLTAMRSSPDRPNIWVSMASVKPKMGEEKAANVKFMGTYCDKEFLRKVRPHDEITPGYCAKYAGMWTSNGPPIKTLGAHVTGIMKRFIGDGVASAMNTPDYYCGGQYFYHRLKLAGKTLATLPKEAPAALRAFLSDLTGATPLPKVAAQVGDNVSSSDRDKCTAFFSRRGIEIATDKDMDLDFSSVAGNESGKRAMYDNVLTPFQLGTSKNVRNVLLYGPPGTGKSLLARALVGELANAAKLMDASKKVTYIPLSVSTLEEKWVGKSEENVRLLFECARAFAPAVIFFDECDSMFKARTSSTSEHNVKTKSEFLVQLDGSFSNKESDLVVFMGATNRPWDLDKAFRRRLPVNVYAGLPTEEGRAQIAEMKMRRYFPENYKDSEWWSAFLHKTNGYSGSDLVNVCKEAVTRAEEVATAACFTKLPTSVSDVVRKTPHLQEKMHMLGPVSVMMESTFTPAQVKVFVEAAQKAVSMETLVATGPKFEDARILRDALMKIQKSVGTKELVRFARFQMELGGEALKDVPLDLRRKWGATRKPKEKSVWDRTVDVDYVLDM